MRNVVLNTLGPLQVLDSGRPINISNVKSRALLAFLSVNKGHVFTREYLADFLWPDSSQEKAGHSLNQSLYNLRKLLPDVLTASPRTVECPKEAVAVDVELWNDVGLVDIVDRLRDIRGPFLTDCALPDADEFERWREDFGRAMLLRIEPSIQAVLRGSQDTRTVAALATIWPGLDALFSPIGINLPPVVVPLEVGPPAIDAAPAQAGANSTPQPFIGREEELAILRGLWQRAIARSAQFAVVQGRPGLGKTRLVSTFLDGIEPIPLRLVSIRCYEAERQIPFASAAELVRQLAPGYAQFLTKPLRYALQQIVPDSIAEPIQRNDLNSQAAESRLFECLVQLVLHASRDGSLIISIDDAQWCDRSTNAALSYLSRRIQNAPVFVLATIRHSSFKRTSVPYRAWQTIDVVEFTRSELARFLTADEGVLKSQFKTPESLHRATGGHPYLVAELLKFASSNREARASRLFPPSVSDFISEACADLTPLQQILVSAMAVVAKPARMEMIQRVANSKNLTRAVDAVVQRGLIEVDGQGRFRFKHDLLREGAYRRIPLASRMDMHRRVAKHLVKHGGRVGEIASHYYRARELAEAYSWSVRAAEEADRRNALRESIYFLRIATRSSQLDNVALRIRIAERLRSLSRFQQAANEIADLLASAEELPSNLRAEIKILDIELRFALGHVSDADITDLLEKLSRDSAVEEQMLIRLTRLLLRASLLYGNKSRADVCINRLRDFGFKKFPRREGVESLVIAMRGAAMAFSTLAAEEWARPLRKFLDSNHDHITNISVLHALTVLSYTLGNFPECDGILRRLIREIDSVGAVSDRPMALTHLHMIAVETGNYIEAEAIVAELDSSAIEEHLQTHLTINGNKAIMLLDLEDYDAAAAAAKKGLAAGKGFRSVWHEIGMMGTIGLAELGRGNIVEAKRIAKWGKDKIDAFHWRVSDLSMMEMLIARISVLDNRRPEAITRLQDAIEEYRNRDVICRLRLQLELARTLKPVDRNEARNYAREVYEKARTIGARPLADRADSLLNRV